jgi:hypothetical protein
LKGLAPFRRTLEWVVFGNIWLAAGALLLSLQTLAALGRDLFWLHPYWGFVFFGSWSLYAFHNVVTLRLGGENAFLGARWAFIRARQPQWKGIAAASFFLSAGFYLLLPGAFQQQLIWPGVLSLLYLAPILPGRKRLRDIPWAKSFTIALVWAWLTGVIPAGIGKESLPVLSLTSLAAERFFFVLGLTLPFDIRDRDQDLRLGLKTLPIHIGDRATRGLALISIGITAALVLWNRHQLPYSSGTTTALWVALAGSGLLIGQAHGRRPEWFYSLGMDGMLVLQPALVLITYGLSQ